MFSAIVAWRGLSSEERKYFREICVSLRWRRYNAECFNQQQVLELGWQTLLHIYNSLIICHSCRSASVCFPPLSISPALRSWLAAPASHLLICAAKFQLWETNCQIVYAFMSLVPAFCLLPDYQIPRACLYLTWFCWDVPLNLCAFCIWPQDYLILCAAVWK